MPPSSRSDNTVCGLDIGSNTFSFTEIAKKSSGGIEHVADASIGVRLSEGLIAGGELAPEAVTRGLTTIEELARAYQLRNKRVRAVATAVLRQTCEPKAFLEPAEAILGHPIEIIDGKEEARLTQEGATFGLQSVEPWIILDIGGQSTEFSWHTQVEWHSISLEIGVVGLTELYLHHDPPTPDEISTLRVVVQHVLKDNLPAGLTGRLLAVAGTASSLGMLHQSMRQWNRERLHGSTMDSRALSDWMSTMSAITSHERQHRFGVRPVRADVFPAGICVIEEAIRHFSLDQFTISATGLRLGAALSIL